MELNSKPYKIIKTMMSKKPSIEGLWYGGLILLLSSLLSLQAWQNPALFDWAASSGEAVFAQKEYYRLLTAIFLHGDLGHLLSNAYMLLVLSIFFYGTLGFNRVGTFGLVLLSFAGGLLTQVLTLMSYPPQVRLLGASGLVYFLAGFWFFSYLMIDRRRRILARSLRVVGVSLMILFPTTFEENVSYLAHFHGFWLGGVFGLSYFFLFRRQIRSYEEYQMVEPDFGEVLESAIENQFGDLK